MNEKQAEKKMNQLQEWFESVGCPETYLGDDEWVDSSMATIYGNGFPGECLVEPPKEISKIISELLEYSNMWEPLESFNNEEIEVD